MAIYFTDSGIMVGKAESQLPPLMPYLLTSPWRVVNPAVHQLPWGLTVITGLAAPKAAAGAKTFASKARGKVSAIAFLQYNRPCDGVLSCRVTATCDLHIATVRMDGFLQERITAPRAMLQVENKLPPFLTYLLTSPWDKRLNNVWVDGTLRQRFTATARLSSADNLTGTLQQRFTLTGNLDVSTAGAVNMAGILRERMVGNIAVLSVGTTHMPQALLHQKFTLTGALTINYMQAVLRTKWTTFCDLYVNLRLASSMTMHQTATMSLDIKRAFAASVLMRHTATMRLTMPLQGTLRQRFTATAVPTVRRQIAGSAATHYTASLGLYVGRYLQASVGARQTASLTLTAPRLLAASLSMRESASAALTVAHPLTGILSCRVTALLALTVAPIAHAPIAEITVSPDGIEVVDYSSAEVDSGHIAALVEE